MKKLTLFLTLIVFDAMAVEVLECKGVNEVMMEDARMPQPNVQEFYEVNIISDTSAQLEITRLPSTKQELIQLNVTRFNPSVYHSNKGFLFKKYLLDLVSRLYPDTADIPGKRVIGSGSVEP